MAEVIEDMPFDSSNAKKYPWDEWLDGRIWKLTRGSDFSISAVNMRTTIYARALRRGLRASVSVKEDSTIIVMQAKPKEESAK